MGIGCSGLFGCIGSNPLGALGGALEMLLSLHGVDVSVTRHSIGPATRNIYAEPLDAPTPFSARVLITKQEMKEQETLAGGKREEHVTFMGTPGTLLENDIVAYGGHAYDIHNVYKTTANSNVVAEVYVGVREVDP